MSILAEVVMKKKGCVKKLSLVKSPAVEVDFLKLAEEKEIKLAVQEERQDVTGPVLIPEKRYYRNKEFFNTESGEDGYIFFTAETVREIGMDLLRSGNQINLDHKTDVDKEDVEIVESWIIETPNDKAYDLGFTKEQCPMGTLMQTQHINSDDLWKSVKENKYNGFSIQGNPAVRIIAEGIQLQLEFSDEQIIEEITKIIKNYKD